MLLDSTRSSAVITLIIAGAFMLNYAFTSEGVPQALALWVDSKDLTQLEFLLLVNAVFLVLGCFLDVSVMLLVFVPMLLPAAKLLGIDLVHFGVVVVVNMMIGLVTPPFGMLLFVTNALTGIPIRDMIREGWLFLADAGAAVADDGAVPVDRAMAAAFDGVRPQVRRVRLVVAEAGSRKVRVGAVQSRRTSTIAAAIIAMKNTSVQAGIARPRRCQPASAHSPLPLKTRVSTSVSGNVSSM